MPPEERDREQQAAAALPDDQAAVQQYANTVSPPQRGLARMAGRMALNKRKLLLGGGSVGLVGLLVAAFIAFLPLKLESIMKNILARRFNRVEFAMERRAERIFIKYAIERNSVPVALNASGALVATGNPLTDLYATWKTQKFEDDLANKYGLKLEGRESVNCKSPCKVKVSINSKAIGPPEGFKDASEFQSFLDKDGLTNKEAKAFINKVLQSETHFLQIYKRRHLRLWMRNAYGVRRWKLFNGKSGPEAKTELNKNIVDAEVQPTLDNAGSYLACALGGSDCPTRERGDQFRVDQNKEPAPKVKSGAADTCSSNCGDLQGVLNQANPQALAEAEAGTGAAAGEAAGSGFRNALSDIISKQALGKAIGVVGLLQTLSQIDEVISTNKLGKLIAYKNSLQYADVFATWATLADGIKLGTATGDEVNAAMTKLDGVEKSAAFSALYSPNQPVTGEKMDPEQSVNSDSNGAAKFTVAYQNSPILGNVIHPILAAYRSTVGGIFGAITDFVGGLLNPLINILPGVATVEEKIGQALGSLLSFAIGPALDGTETGAKLLNAIDAGGDVTANDFANSLGAVPLPASAAAQTDQAIAQANQTADTRSLWAKMTDLGQPSLAARLLTWLPSSPQAATAQIGNWGLAAITNPFKSISNLLTGLTTAPALAAADTGDLYGVQQYYWQNLDAPIQTPTQDLAGPPDINGHPGPPDNKIDANDCPSSRQPELYFNREDMCLLDMAAVDSLKSAFTPNDDGGLSQ